MASFTVTKLYHLLAEAFPLARLKWDEGNEGIEISCRIRTRNGAYYDLTLKPDFTLPEYEILDMTIGVDCRPQQGGTPTILQEQLTTQDELAGWLSDLQANVISTPDYIPAWAGVSNVVSLHATAILMTMACENWPDNETMLGLSAGPFYRINPTSCEHDGFRLVRLNPLQDAFQAHSLNANFGMDLFTAALSAEVIAGIESDAVVAVSIKSRLFQGVSSDSTIIVSPDVLRKLHMAAADRFETPEQMIESLYPSAKLIVDHHLKPDTILVAKPKRIIPLPDRVVWNAGDKRTV